MNETLYSGVGKKSTRRKIMCGMARSIGKFISSLFYSFIGPVCIAETTLLQETLYVDSKTRNNCGNCANAKEFFPVPSSQENSGSQPEIARIDIGKLPSTNSKPAIARLKANAVAVSISAKTISPTKEEMAPAMQCTRGQQLTNAKRLSRRAKKECSLCNQWHNTTMVNNCLRISAYFFSTLHTTTLAAGTFMPLFSLSLSLSLSFFLSLSLSLEERRKRGG